MARISVSVVLWSALGCLLLLAACGDDGAGAAAGSGAPPTLGERCAGMQCESGYFCSRAVFADQCSTTCTGPAGCMLLNPRGICVNSECGIACTADNDCAFGATCVEAVDGQMACFLAP